ncbi:MAG: hypothetical protein IJY58_04065 [Alphaproteobacteria bacterium]|nr:hypothetical protein [Alphaproteobacteria bacterium]
MLDEFNTFQSIISSQHTETDTFARFYDKSVKTHDVNPKTGLPVFKDVCYVEIRIKNNNTDIYDQPATPEKIARFPEAYHRYQLTKEKCQEGAPLEHFSFLTSSQINTLKCHGILTVEKLAGLSDQQARDLDVCAEKASAQHFLNLAQQTLTQEQWEKKYQTLQQQIEMLKRENAQLKNHVLSGKYSKTATQRKRKKQISKE